jgi:drug/metabolite transporter superfamily protein YnfA
VSRLMRMDEVKGIYNSYGSVMIIFNSYWALQIDDVEEQPWRGIDTPGCVQVILASRGEGKNHRGAK